MLPISEQQTYKVLARKYRPNNFNNLVGQEVLVRTLSNAIKMQRIAHAFLLSGMRGVGKTTTARIIAKTINCTDLDLNQSIIVPCGKCANCMACSEERHPDIIEMDAASRTGVGDVREIIESVNYLPLMGKMKIYIIDEIHMLSTNAFNALLKTIEEPPAHTKFIFATTEVKKIPITILSRCQRFDLKRLSNDALINHLQNITNLENVKIEQAALDLIIAKSEGSVRDSLSLLDQAIACSDSETAITDEAVRQMLGISCKTSLFSLLELILKGQAKEAIELLHELYYDGVNPTILIEELLEITHLITKIKMVPSLAESRVLPEFDRNKSLELSKLLEVSSLTLIWQMLLKGLAEVKNAPIDISATEMVIIRLCYLSKIPSPLDLLKKIENTQNTVIANENGFKANTIAAGNSQLTQEKHLEDNTIKESILNTLLENSVKTNKLDIVENKKIASYEELVAIFYAKQELIIYHHLVDDIRIVKFSPNEMVIKINNWVSKDVIRKMKQLLLEWTGDIWSIIETQDDCNVSTINEQKLLIKEQAKTEAKSHPVVREILDQFDGTNVVDVREITV
ncbi:DNA polymerase III subunit tau [Rickettsiales bacterium Ac37b]|nr:DNA polymerase III subunit tau [Rickettsiales bacterium Ac37b]